MRAAGPTHVLAGFVLMLNVITAMLFVCLQYSYAITRVDHPFDVAVVTELEPPLCISD